LASLGRLAPWPLPLFFTDSTDDADIRGWREDIERNRLILERIIRYRPDGDLARKARALLAAAKP
jgi:hypothetical protein